MQLDMSVKQTSNQIVHDFQAHSSGLANYVVWLVYPVLFTTRINLIDKLGPD